SDSMRTGMIASMTAFGRLEQSGDWGNAVWELRSVNHRYLEISLRVPEELRTLESRIREQVTAKVNRGKVDCLLRYQPPAGDDGLRVNAPLAAQLIQAAESLPVAAPASINVIDVLRWPGVIEKPALDLDALAIKLMQLLDATLDVLIETRRREGARMRDVLDERCGAAHALLAGLRGKLPSIQNALRERCLQRARELQVELDRERLEQELLYLGQKMDAAEELDRLDAHVAEVRRVLARSEPVGRRLDFLMQEMNREANTLGSKSASLELSNASVELKVLIEQMREQIQNIE
ncbi:MAG: YicC/YloC family endoribonuclease, partial [Gammaproteobacteria bacterium]